jgi:hypothetical protein
LYPLIGASGGYMNVTVLSDNGNGPDTLNGNPITIVK